MKLAIFLALVFIMSQAATVHGICSKTELLKCAINSYTCKDILEAVNCFKRCDVNVPSQVTEMVKKYRCGASALTNIGLPLLLLVGMAVFYNN